MATEQLVSTIQWGNIVFCLENEAFRKSFEDGLHYYFKDAEGEEPQIATKLTTGELLRQIAVSDLKTGHYRLDEMSFEFLEEYLGAFLGYMSRPLAMVKEVKSEREAI